MEIQRSQFVKAQPQLLLFAFLFLMAACEDPSNVGLGLVDADGGQPVTSPLALTEFQNVSEDKLLTGTGQALAGQVLDPTFGTIQTSAFVDMQNNSNKKDAYRNGTIEKALLTLETNYAYGDTLEPLTFAVHEVNTEFKGTITSPDSLPTVGAELLQFTMQPTDSLVSLELPESWITAHDADMRGVDFDLNVHGFQIVPISGNAVIGFHTATNRETALLGIVGPDTVKYATDRGVTELEKSDDAMIPENRLGFQNGTGPKIRLNFDLDSLQNRSLNRIALQLPVDTLSLITPANFARPSTLNLSLHGALNDSTFETLAIAPINDEGTVNFVSETFHGVIQQFLIGLDPYDYYEVRFSGTSAATVNGILLHDLNSDNIPQVYFTYTPLD